EDGRVAREFVPPEIRAEHHHGITARNLVFVLPKPAAQPRLDSEYMKIVTGNHHAAFDPRRGSGLRAETDSFHIRVGDYTVVTLRFVADVEVFAIGEIVEGTMVRSAHQSDNASRMRHGIRPEDQRVDHAECRRGHPDPERERDHHERGESWRA